MAVGIVLLAGCATLAPERYHAEQLMGKPINEAFKVFGRPFMVGEAKFSKADDKFNGQKQYLFVRSGVSFDKSTVVGGDNSWTPGGLVHTTYVETTRVHENCQITLLTNSANIIDYYEIKGNCGFMDAGFGNTGALHRLGIN